MVKNDKISLSGEIPFSAIQITTFQSVIISVPMPFLLSSLVSRTQGLIP